MELLYATVNHVTDLPEKKKLVIFQGVQKVFFLKFDQGF